MSGIEISVSGLLAQGRRVESFARNIANVNTFPDSNNIPVDTVTISRQNGGVSTADVEDPNASLESQVVGLLSAKTSYEANAKVIKTQQEIDQSLLDIIT
jgi:flagellar basal body rod protein FlgC